MNFLFFRDKERADTRKVRYAAIGAGWITQEDFLPGIADTDNSEIVALVTGDPEKARELGKKYDITVCRYDGYADLLRSGKIDAVYIALPNHLHRDYSLLALNMGIHVLLEKPMARTEEECLELINASQQSGSKLMVAYRLHFEPATLHALETVRSGKIGEPRFFTALLTQQILPDNHRLEAKNWAGPLQDVGPYPINAARQLFQAEPLEVFAYACSGEKDARFKEIAEMVSVQLLFPGQRLAQFIVSYGANAVDHYRIVGTEGDLNIEPGFTWQAKLNQQLTVGTKKSEKPFDMVNQFGGETRYFSDCILDDRHPEPDGWEGLADVRIIQAVEKSLAEKRPVAIKPMIRPHRPSLDQVETLPAIRKEKMVNAESASGT